MKFSRFAFTLDSNFALSRATDWTCYSSFNTAVALTCFLSTVSAKIDLAAPSNPVSGGGYTVTWTHESSDPDQFTLMLQLASDSWATGQFWEFTETKLDKLDVTFLNTDPYVISTKR
jgi:hypothetical protein